MSQTQIQHIKVVGTRLNSEIKLNLDAITVLSELLHPYIDLFISKTEIDDILDTVCKIFPKQLSDIISKNVKGYTESCLREPQEIIKTIKLELIDCLIVGILEEAFDIAQLCSSREVDSYFIYAGIYNNPDLYSFLGSKIPNYIYPDLFSIEDFIKENFPYIKLSTGFYLALKNHIDIIAGTTIAYDCKQIDSLSKRYGLGVRTYNRKDAIIQLKQNIIKYVISKSSTTELSFSNIVTTLKLK